jgi:hypothetical protein
MKIQYLGNQTNQLTPNNYYNIRYSEQLGRVWVIVEEELEIVYETPKEFYTHWNVVNFSESFQRRLP